MGKLTLTPPNHPIYPHFTKLLEKKKEILIKFQRKLKNMDFNVEKKEKIPITLQSNVAILFRIKGTLAGKDITILLHLLKGIIILVLNLLTI